jgi:hypothetical protein
MKMPFCRMMFATLSVGVCSSLFGQLAVTPALPEKAWARKIWLPRFDAKKALWKKAPYFTEIREESDKVFNKTVD